MTKTYALARLLWNYLRLAHRLKQADVIVVLGSNDVRVAEHAADLYLAGWAPKILFSGGLGRLTQGLFERPEADIFADVAMHKGVPAASILREAASTNTGENIRFTQALLAQKGLNVASVLVVQKPYMERRAYATCKKHWPDKDIILSSPATDFDDYPNALMSVEDVIHAVVGELERIQVYPLRGFQLAQEIPSEVWRAYEDLVAAGYTGQRIL